MVQVSIIIPLYNTEDYIVDALDSVSSQYIESIEVIVVDDHSTDQGFSIVEDYISNNQSVKIIKNIYKKGVSGARNTGIQAAKGKYIGFLDADDILLYPDALQEKVTLMEKQQDLNLVCSDFLRFNETSDIINNAPYFESQQGLFDTDSFFVSCTKSYIINSPVEFYLKKCCLVVTGAVLIRNSHLKSVGMFDESLTHGEDVDLWYRLSVDQSVAFINKASVGYRVRTGSATTNEYKTRFGAYFVRKNIFKNKSLKRFRHLSLKRLKEEGLSLIYFLRENKKFWDAFTVAIELLKLDPFDKKVLLQVVAIVIQKS